MGMMGLEGCFDTTLPLHPRTVTLGSDAASVVPLTVNSRRGGRPNRISTVRFPSPVVLTWLPKSLFAQFMRAANRYFLFVSCLVFVPFSPTSWSSTALPFAGVLLWSALKDLYEDMRRRRDDAAENLRPCMRYDQISRKFVEIRWEQVLCGDVLLARQDQVFPADVLIVASESGRAFISTAALDGETNLKERRPPAPCSLVLDQDGEHTAGAGDSTLIRRRPSANRSIAEAVAGIIYAKGFCAAFDEPKVGFDDMGGKVSFKGVQASEAVSDALYAEHFAPRGCVLRNTAWLVVVVAYVGDESKSRLNVAVLKAKFSNLQVYLNRCILALVGALSLFCFYAASMAAALGDGGRIDDFFVRFFQYWIILYQIVPISLYVCFEVVKLLLGLQINLDKEMMDPLTRQHAVARTADLVEEMGQVHHIFSDKTGTITQNEMRFAMCSIDDTDLGDFRPPDLLTIDIGKLGVTATADPEGVMQARRIMTDPRHPLHEETRRFFMCLAACHSAQVDVGEDGEPLYSGSSPDEVAFLDAARAVGMVFRAQRLTPRDGSAAVQMTIETPAPDGQKTLTIVAQIPFTSDRKRMSVVCEIEGELMCITKGADSVMQSLCDSSLTEKSMKRIDDYARLGLRTLVVAWKAVPRQFLAVWKRDLEAAKGGNADDRPERLAAVAVQLEHDLRLTGISAIEDRLQDGVPLAMATLKAMGIRIWVLTGDKVETAVEIARACQLLTEGMAIVRATNATSLAQAKEQLREALRTAQVFAGKACAGSGDEATVAFVLDGGTMKYVTDDEEAQELLFQLGLASKVCVCCRLAPQQKRRLVELVRERDKSRITLAIGDGANDVPMIQGAHVGIGVRGKEGNQSVQASDVALSQFRFLVPLLLCHGRRAYRRVAVFLCYYVYKHVVLAVGDMCWAHQSNFAGQIAYPEWIASCYAGLFTSLPVIVVLTMDRDLPDHIVMRHPELYAAGQHRMHFNPRRFSVWMLSGVWHGCLSWLVPNLVIGADSPGISPNFNKDWWIGSIVSFSLVLVCVDFRLWLVALNKLSPWTLLGLLSSPVLYLTTLIVFGHTYLGEWMQPQLAGVPLAVLKDAKAMAALFLAPLALAVDALIYMLILHICPSPLDEVRRTFKPSRVSPPLGGRTHAGAVDAAA